MKKLVLVSLVCVWAACGARTPLAVPGADAVSVATPGLVVNCNDGTGNTDCCPDGVAAPNACSDPELECWTRCTQGVRGHLVCGDEGTWMAGLGLFPCGADGGVANGLQACNDGTGNADCCADGVTSGAPCTESDLPCKTRCSGGTKGQFACSQGSWLAGHGLFPCAVGGE